MFNLFICTTDLSINIMTDMLSILETKALGVHSMMPTTDLCWCIISSTVVSLIRDDIVDKLLHIETSMNCFQNHLSALYFSVWTFITLCLMTLHSRYVLVNRTTKILYITTISMGTTVFSNNGLPVKRVQNTFLTTTRGWYANVYHQTGI